MTIRLQVVDRQGNAHEVTVVPVGSLMEALRELEYGVAAICGGMCSCATCHVYVDERWSERLSPRHGDEVELLAQLEHRAEHSRLACQIRLSSQLDGLRVRLAPEE
jgi:ferredoxin, 2Fe-2S